MKDLDHLLLYFPLALSIASAAETPRPRGVGPEFAKFYKSPTTFTCISTPYLTLPIARLNDDFCDCPDGSDEPGTAACAHLSPLSPHNPGSGISDDNDANVSLALPGFWCKNKGHRPGYVPFTVVNDGVCDWEGCCDGSDEWAKVGGVRCEDRCKEVGREWRRKDELRQKSLGNAGKRRRGLVGEAARVRLEVEGQISTLRTLVEAGEIKVRGLEGEVRELERRERGKVVRKVKGVGGSKAGMLVGLARERVKEVREALVEVRGQRDEGLRRIEELEGILRTFKEEYNPNFNDEGVKRAVRGWENYAAREKVAIKDELRDRDLDEIAKPDGEEGGIKWSEWEEEEESDVDVLYKIEEYLPTPVRNWVDQKLRDLRLLLIENGILAPNREPGSESKELEDARAALKVAEDDINNSRNRMTNHADDLAKDYGADDVFRALKGHCVSKDSGEYTYELCWLDQTKQKSKKSGSSTNMGSFASFTTVIVDNDLPSDGKGLGSGERVALKYENGQHCWNGPNRQTLVVLGCAETDEVWKVSEEEKCVYWMEVGTPAVCGAEGGKKEGDGVRDEL